MKSGIVKVYRQAQGYAIIAPDEPGPDVFLHFSAIIDRKVLDRMCVGLPVIYEAEQDKRGWKATRCWADVAFTWLDLPASNECQWTVAVRDDRNGTVECFFDKPSARAWMTLRRGLAL